MGLVVSELLGTRWLCVVSAPQEGKQAYYSIKYRYDCNSELLTRPRHPTTRDPKTRDRKTRDQKTRDPKTRDPTFREFERECARVLCIFSVIVWRLSDLLAILNRDAVIVLGVSHPPFSFIRSAEWSMFANERRQERRKSAKHEGKACALLPRFAVST